MTCYNLKKDVIVDLSKLPDSEIQQLQNNLNIIDEKIAKITKENTFDVDANDKVVIQAKEVFLQVLRLAIEEETNTWFYSIFKKKRVQRINDFINYYEDTLRIYEDKICDVTHKRLCVGYFRKEDQYPAVARVLAGIEADNEKLRFERDEYLNNLGEIEELKCKKKTIKDLLIVIDKDHLQASHMPLDIYHQLLHLEN